MSREELQRLLSAREHSDLDVTDHQRLQQLLEDDDLLEAAVDQLEVDALLRWHHGAVAAAVPAAAEQPRPLAWRWPRVLQALAAALLLAFGIFWFWPPETGHFGVELVANWRAQPTGDAEFTVLQPRRIHLTRGELFVQSTGTSAGTLSITTPYGEVHAHGTAFFVGAHETIVKTKTKETMTMSRNLTRVLVLSGTVTLSNALGAAVVGANELAVAPQGDPPTKVVATSSGNFGFDLYRTLAASHKGENLFFSPYSIATALTMTAEGARGLTAEEMAKVLRWPEAARRVGEDAQRIPFELAKIHGGYAELNRLLRAGQSPEQEKLRQRIAELTASMRQVQQRIDAAQAAGDRRARNEARREMRALGREYDSLAGNVKSYRLSIANALWGQKTYPFDKDYLRVIDASYETGAFIPADFRSDPAREVARINAWVEKQTEGRIKNLAYEPVINRNTRLALVNAIYFKAHWLTPFVKERTKPGSFTTASGATVQANMMRHYGLEECRYAAVNADGSSFDSPRMIDVGQKEGLYPDTGGFQILELPYQGHDLAMVLLLPVDPDGLGALEAKLTAKNVATWLSKLEKRKTSVRMPRFKAETAYKLNDALKELGMPRAFNPSTGLNGADFTGMTTTTDPAEQLFIQAVLHKAFVTVDEEGTEAAAATMVAAGIKGAAPRRMPFVPYFNAERPFVFMIRDLWSGTILFLGRMTKP